MYHQPFQVNPLAKTLPQDRLQCLLEQQPHVKIYQQGSIIYHQGDQAPSFYYLKQGQVRIFFTSKNGIERTLAVLHPGNIFGEASFFDEFPRMSSAKADQRCQLIEMTQEILLKHFSQHPMVAFDLLQYLSQTIRMLSTQVTQMAFQTAQQRIISILLRLYHQKNLNCIVSSHQQLATDSGVSRVTVSRILKQLEKSGLLVLGYKKIFIVDAIKLQMLLY